MTWVLDGWECPSCRRSNWPWMKSIGCGFRKCAAYWRKSLNGDDRG